MMDMDSTELQSLLRRLCSDSVWKYAVFWKLKHRARMVLTWADAYYDSQGQPDLSKAQISNEMVGNSPILHYSHDPLGLAVAKMSYHVYSLGEGIVGKVAVTGKYQWICADDNVTNSCLSYESCDGWQQQFLAGIRTVAVVPIVPHGVVQLGSLQEVNEDIKLVSHIQGVFSALQDPTRQRQYNSVDSAAYSFLHDLSVDGSVSDGFLMGFDEHAKGEPSITSTVSSTSAGPFESTTISDIHQKKAVKVPNRHQQLIVSQYDKNNRLGELGSSSINFSNRKGENMKLTNKLHFEGAASCLDGVAAALEPNVSPYFHKYILDNLYSPGIPLPHEPVLIESSSISSDLLAVDYDVIRDGRLDTGDYKCLHSSGLPETVVEDDSRLTQMETSSMPLTFSTMSELHEALGPDFLKKKIPSYWEEEKTAAGMTVGFVDGISSNQLADELQSEHLLEAVVAKVCLNENDEETKKSISEPATSLAAPRRVPEAWSLSKLTASSVSYATDLTSNIGGVKSSSTSKAMSSSDFSSACPTSCSELLERSSEPTKNSRKRARPGENRRPRPRDRQLIQDRLKELRELVPNGSKCSIDSLLERTIKHMLFLQSITKHADKLSKCGEAKFHRDETDMLRSISNEQGTSWAVELGNHLKVHSIMVENFSKNGQLLVEMLCEECTYFLEIAEAIRSLGLTILKGITEAHGEKIWICFVVEGQSDKSIRRMDILWSLVQILQLKT